MSEIKVQGLRGLRGLGELSESERKKFYADNAAILSQYNNNPMHYGIVAERLYNNQKFINTFGEDAFDKLNDGTKASYDYRNQMFHDKTVYDAFQEKFGRIDTPENRKKHPFTSEVASQLDIQGMYDLLTNEDYMGPIERRKQYQANLNSAKKVGKSFDAAINNPYVDALGAGYMEVGKVTSAMTPAQKDAEYAKRDKEILDKLYAETQQRREDEIQDAADIMYANMLSNDDSGRKSLAQYYKEFDKIASNNNYGYYATFKNSKWLKDYTNEDKLKDYAKYLALKQKYGEGMASAYLQRTIQNKVADAQDGAWTGNTLKGVLTTTWSDLGSNVALFANVGKSADDMAILNQGKDPRKPIYDKDGNIIDYQRNDDWVTNPAYWNNVYKYNTFSPTEIKAIEERGGISEDVNVREFGYTPDFLSWDTVEEGFKQGGHVIAGIVETGLTGAAGRMLGWAGNGAMKMMGLSAKAMQSASKAGRIANNILVGATSGLEGSQLEAMGTFDEQLQTNKEKIQQQITRELYDYQRTINYNSKQAKQGIDDIYKQLKSQDSRRIASSNREGTRAFPLSDETLRAQAKQLYTNQLLGAKQKELQELHKEDELQAARDAQKAYTSNFIMDYIKNIPLTVGIQKYKIAKGSMRSEFDNIMKENIVADTKTGGVKRGVEKTITKDGKTEKVLKDSKYSSGKKLGLEIAKQFGGGFLDEYLDGINASFASGVGNNEFDNYIKRQYDHKAYSSTVDSMLGNLLAGMSEGIDGITDRQNLYEGFIGMISPAATATVNVNAIFRPKDTWKAVFSGTDVNGEKLGKIDRVSSILMNPLLNTVTEAREKDRNIDKAVDVINNVVAANKGKVQDAAKVISVLDNYNSPLQNNNGLLDSKDNKLLNTFTLINVMNTLENVDGGTSTALYKETMDTMEGLANGTLSKEQMDSEIDKFLADADNKSILDQGEEGRKIAAKRLQSNAKYFMDMKDRLTEVEDIFANSPSLKNLAPGVKEVLAYNVVASEDYKKRLQTLEDELGVSKTDTESLFRPDYGLRYYTNASRNKAVLAREREIDKTQKEIDKIKEENEKTRKKITSLKAEREATTDEDRKVTMGKLIDKKENLLKSNEFNLKSAEERKRQLVKEKEEISKLTDTPAIDESTILNADARDRAFILDPKNRDNYSEEVQSIIDNVANRLKQKDPEALTKVQDAATLAYRVGDMRTLYNRVLDNNELAAVYLDAVDATRKRAAFAESLQDEINKYYSQIGDAYVNKEKDPMAFKEAILSKSPELIEAYMEDHPGQADGMRAYYEMLKFDMDAGAVMSASGFTKDEKNAIVNTLVGFNSKANNRKELEEMIEGLIDSPDVPENVRENFDYVMSKLKEMGYQRNATVLEKRAERKKREAEEKAKKEEAQKKAEEEAKAAADKKAEEGKTKESAAPDNDSDINEGISDDTFKASNVNAEDGIDMFGEESKPSNAEAKETPAKEQPNKEEKPKPVTRIDYGNNVIQVTPDEYESLPDTAKHEENAIFEAHSAEKDGDNWYFIGNFAGDKNETKVKSTKNLDTETSNNRQQPDNKGKSAADNMMPGDKNVIIEGDGIKGQSPSLEQQLDDAKTEGNDAQIIPTPIDDVDTSNEASQQMNNTNAYSLSGNAMSRYEPKDLEKNGKIVNKAGAKEGDKMNKYYAWMEAAGIKLQNIIDMELARIIDRNPHAKVRFMGVKPEKNATNDMNMLNHCMLVLDYDNSINKGITAIHDNANGGVIESEGKKYLIIGVVGFPYGNKYKQGLRDILWNSNIKDGLRMTVARKKFFDEHPDERFYVNKEFSTEIVPYSQIPGYIVKQTVNDKEPKHRNVSEILADKERNPLGLTMKELAWGIQSKKEFLITGNISADRIMAPRNSERNMGSVFVLVPASNGKYVPAYIKPIFYNEMTEGALTEEAESLLKTVATLDFSEDGYKAAIEAIDKLCEIFYLSPDGDDIHRSGKTLTVVSKSDPNNPTTFTLDSSFKVDAFIKAFENMNPRVNITISVLRDAKSLKEYEEAGALTTDMALFHTVGSSYSIYALDKGGNMIMPESPTNPPKSVNDSTYRKEQTQVVYDHQYYIEDNGTYSLDGKVVTGPKLIEQLQYNKRIIDGKLVPVMSNNAWQYYILNTGDHPEVIRVDKNTKEVDVLAEEQARKLIEKINEEQAKSQRTKAAKEAIEKDNEKALEEAQNANIPDSDIIIDENTGEAIQENAPDNPKEESVKESSIPVKKPNEDNVNKGLSEPKGKNDKAPTQTFAELYNNKSYKMKVIKLLKKKWKDIPKSLAEKEAFLRGKNVEVDTIGTSKEDIEAWMKTIEDCR